MVLAVRVMLRGDTKETSQIQCFRVLEMCLGASSALLQMPTLGMSKQTERSLIEVSVFKHV